MKYLSMFSGIEAATVAWEPLGFEPVAFCEIEPFPSAVLAHRFPNVPNLGDVERADFDAIGPVDIAVFGSPCQSYSVAGKRLGLDDPRGNLALVAGQVVFRKRPRWFVFENVPGLLSSDNGWDFGTLLAAFAGYKPGAVFEPPADGWKSSGIVVEAEGGYGLAWRVLDAQYFGLPQRRKRVLIVGHLGDWRRAAAVLFERESLSRNSPPRREARERVAPTISARPTGGGGLGTDFDCDGGLIASTGNVSHCLNAGGMGRIDYESETLCIEHKVPTVGNVHGDRIPVEGPSSTVRRHLHGEPSEVVHDTSDALPLAFSCKDHGADSGEVSPSLRAMGHDGSHANAGGQVAIAIQERAVSENPDAGPDGAGYRDNGCAYTLEARQTPQAVAFDTTQVTSKANRSNPKAGDPCHPLAAGAHAPAVAFNVSPGKGHKKDDLHVTAADTSKTIDAHAGNPTLHQGGTFLAHQWAVRRLTPEECEALQGFPRGFTRIPYRGKPASECPDGPRYKALGNSFAVPVVRWIGERIAAVDAIQAREKAA